MIPLAGSLVDDGSGETDEEQKLRNESRKILHLPDLLVAGTCVRVPVFTGHSLSIHAEFAEEISVPGPPACWPPLPASSWSTSPTRARPPARTPCYVGRIRADQSVPGGRGLVICSSAATTCARVPR